MNLNEFLSLCVFAVWIMPRSPMSSEEEMAQSFSDSVSSESDSSRDEPPRLDRPTSGRQDNNTTLICVVIPDLQQSVRTHTLKHTHSLKQTHTQAAGKYGSF